jgi:hypothetical protein
MGESPEIELVRRAWDALIAGGPEVLGEVLAPNVQSYGATDGPSLVVKGLPKSQLRGWARSAPCSPFAEVLA